MGEQCLSSSFPKLFRLLVNKEAKVSEVITNSSSSLSWNIQFSRELCDWKVDILGNLMSFLNEVFLSQSFLDHRIWILESSSQFSSKYLLLSFSHPSNPSNSFPIEKVWNPPAPRRVKAFSWIVALNRMITMYMLQRKRPFMYTSPNWCALYRRDRESVSHLFLHYSFTKAI